MTLNQNLIIVRGKISAISLVVILALLNITACSRGDLPPSPIGDKAVLEKLANAFRDEANRFAWSPRDQTPSSKRDFVENVFAAAGYNYDKTLAHLAANKLESGNQLHRDLVELVFYPTNGISQDDIAKIYDDNEVAAIQKIKSEMR